MKIENWIDEALKTEINFELSKGFKNSVLTAIKKKELRSEQKVYLLIVLGVILMVLAGYVCIALFFPDLIQKMSQEKVNKLIPTAVIAVVLIALVQYLDKKLIKERGMVN
ncbi:MAG: hypothetical protein AAF600_21955 [Bacteroidota bacterium]